MSRPLKPLSILAILTALACWNPPAEAQGNFEIQVYGSETTAPGTWMVESHSNSALRGTTSQNAGSIRPTQDSVHETLEVTHGWTPWLETDAYLFTILGPRF
jgi:hypothetical protein